MLVLGLILARTALGFNPPIARLPVILKDLSKLAGTELQCSPDLENEVLYINAMSETPKSVMNEIAYVLEANWVQLDGKVRLSRPLNWAETQRKRKEERAEKLMAKLLGKASPKQLTATEMVAEVKRIKALRDVAEKTGNHNNGWYGQMGVVARQLPAGKLLEEIAKSLGAKKLAQVEPWGNAVYSNNPTKMQRQLPSSLNAAVLRFAVDHNAVAKDLAVPKVDGVFDPWGNDNPLSGWGELSLNFRLLIKVSATPTSASIHLYAFDEGKICAHAYRNESAFGGGASELSEGETAVVQPKPGQLVGLNELSKGFYSGRIFEESERSGIQTYPAALDILTHPFDKEFLQITNSEMLDAYCAGVQKPVVALVPDDSIATSYRPNPKYELDLNHYLAMFKWFEGSPLSHGDWMVLGRSPIARSRVSRAGLQSSLRLAKTEGRVSLANIADLIAKTPPEADYWVRDYFAEVSLPVHNYWPFDLPRLYGTFSRPQKQQLQSGAVLTPDLLSDHQKPVVLRLLFTEHNDLTTLIKTRTGPTPLEYWPTQHLPNGVASLQGIKADYQDGESWFKSSVRENSKSPDRPPRTIVAPVYPELLTGELAAFQRPDLFLNPDSQRKGADPRKAWKFHKGNSTVWDFTFMISESLDRLGSLRDDSHDSSRTYTYSELPDSFRTACEDGVTKVIARYEKLKAEGKLNPPRKGNPPPWSLN